MPAMGAADRGDVSGMPGNRQPIVNRGTYPSPHQRRVAAAFMPGDQQDHSVTLRNRTFQLPVNRFPSPIEAVTVQVEDSIRLDPA